MGQTSNLDFLQNQLQNIGSLNLVSGNGTTTNLSASSENQLNYGNNVILTDQNYQTYITDTNNNNGLIGTNKIVTRPAIIYNENLTLNTNDSINSSLTEFVIEPIQVPNIDWKNATINFTFSMQEKNTISNFSVGIYIKTTNNDYYFYGPAGMGAFVLYYFKFNQTNLGGGIIQYNFTGDITQAESEVYLLNSTPIIANYTGDFLIGLYVKNNNAGETLNLSNINSSITINTIINNDFGNINLDTAGLTFNNNILNVDSNNNLQFNNNTVLLGSGNSKFIEIFENSFTSNNTTLNNPNLNNGQACILELKVMYYSEINNVLSYGLGFLSCLITPVSVGVFQIDSDSVNLNITKGNNLTNLVLDFSNGLTCDLTYNTNDVYYSKIFYSYYKF